MTLLTHRIYLCVIGVLLLLIILQRACVKPCPSQPIVKTDTIVPPVKADSTPAYTPRPLVFTTGSGILSYYPVFGPYRPDPMKKSRKPSVTKTLDLYLDTSSTRPKEAEVNALEGILDTGRIAFYSDTIPVKGAVGYMVIKDSVAGVIVKRQIVNRFSIPMVTKTYTSKLHNQVYLGGAIAGTLQEPLSFAGLSIGFKTKRDQLYSVKALQSLNGGGMLYMAEVQTKLSFRPL